MAVSINDIAREAGTSNVTVSLALRGNARISAARRAQINALAKQMGYRADPLARAMRTQLSLTVGLLMANVLTGVSNLKIDAIEQRLVEAGYQTLLGFTGGDWRRLQQHILSMVDRRVDGIIVYGNHGDAKEWKAVRDALGDRMPPCILADFQANVTSSPFIDVDRAAGTAMLTRHLLEFHHRDIVFVSVPEASPQKWLGVVRAARETPPSDRPKLRRLFLWPKARGNAVNPLSRILETGAEIGRQLAKIQDADRPTGVIAMSDVVAMAVIRGLSDEGLDVPKDISVCGFDGEDFATHIFRPSLTTMLQPGPALAECVVHTLLDLMKGQPPERAVVLLRPTMIVGQSTGPARTRTSQRSNTNRKSNVTES